MDIDCFDGLFEQLQSGLDALSRAPEVRAGKGMQRLRRLNRLNEQLRQRCGAISDHDKEAARLAAIVDCSDDAILSKDLAGIVTSWNPAAEARFLVIRAREIVGESIRLLIPSEKMAEEEMILRRLRRGRPIKHYETVRCRKDGTRVDVSIFHFAHTSAIPPGKVCARAKIIRDISERKTAEINAAPGTRAEAGGDREYRGRCNHYHRRARNDRDDQSGN